MYKQEAAVAMEEEEEELTGDIELPVENKVFYFCFYLLFIIYYFIHLMLLFLGLFSPRQIQTKETSILQPRAHGLRVEQVQPNPLRPRQPTSQGRPGLQV